MRDSELASPTWIRRAANELFWRLLWGNKFIRHSQVDDFQTNPNVGAGHGMARTKNTLDLVVTLRLLRGLKRMAAIDLGCGDGAALKVLTLAGFQPVLGIEFDPELTEIARRNNKHAQVVCGDFTNLQYLKEFSYEGPISLAYAFNPTSGALLSQALEILAARNKFTLILRNPVALETIKTHGNLQVTVRRTLANIAICTVESITTLSER
jgi:SAM-dependent methyltransferase